MALKWAWYITEKTRLSAALSALWLEKWACFRKTHKTLFKRKKSSILQKNTFSNTSTAHACNEVITKENIKRKSNIQCVPSLSLSRCVSPKAKPCSVCVEMLMCRQAPTTNTSFISVSNLHKSLETIPVSHCLAPNSVTKGKVLKAKKNPNEHQVYFKFEKRIQTIWWWW